MADMDSPQPEGNSLYRRLHSEFGFIAGNFLIMVLSWLILDFFSEMPATYYPLYVQALGGTAASIGVIGAVEMVARGLVQIPGGYLADKYGRRWLISTMTLVAAMGRIFYVLAPSWEWITLGAMIVGLTNIYGPALNAIVADSVPKERRGMAFSIINLIASVSTTPAPLIAGLLYVQMGLVPSMRLGYGLMMAGFICAALMRMRLKETVENPTRINISEMVASYPRSMKESVDVWRLVPKSAFVLFLAYSLTNFLIGTYQSIFTLYIIRDLGIAEVDFSYIMTALFVTMIVIALPSGKIIDKIGKKKPLMAAYLLWAFAVPLFLWGDFWRLILAMSLVGLIQVLVSGAGNALFADLVPKEHRGKVNGSNGFFNMIALAIGQLLGGWMYDNVNHGFPFFIQLSLIWVPFLMIFLYVEEPEKKES